MDDRDTLRQRTREAAHLQTIESNPLDADDVAMFVMFDRDELSAEAEIAYIRADWEGRIRERDTAALSSAAER